MASSALYAALNIAIASTALIACGGFFQRGYCPPRWWVVMVAAACCGCGAAINYDGD